MAEKAKTQANGVSPISGVAPPKAKQFGQPGGNPQGRGFWKREATPRFKLERMITLSAAELQTIKDDANAPAFEQAMADIILQAKTDQDKDGTPRPAAMRFNAIGDMIDQIYGKPKQVQETKLEAQITGVDITFKDETKRAKN